MKKSQTTRRDNIVTVNASAPPSPQSAAEKIAAQLDAMFLRILNTTEQLAVHNDAFYGTDTPAIDQKPFDNSIIARFEQLRVAFELLVDQVNITTIGR